MALRAFYLVLLVAAVSGSPNGLYSSSSSSTFKSANSKSSNDQSIWSIANDEAGGDGELNEEPANGVKPSIISEEKILTVKEGSTVELPCDVKDLGEFVILWRRRGNRVILFAGTVRVNDNQRLQLGPRHQLIIQNVERDDEGDYVCEVSTNPPMILRHNLTIYDPTVAPPHTNEIDSDASVSSAIVMSSSSTLLTSLLICISALYAVKNYQC